MAARTRSLHQVSLALTSVARRGWHPPPNALFVPPSRLPKPRSAGPLGRGGRRGDDLRGVASTQCTNAAGAEKVGVPLDARMKFV